MDIIKEKKRSALSTWQMKAVFIALVIALTGFFLLGRSESDFGDINVVEVKRGDLEVSVDGYGILTSSKQRVVTAVSKATVKDIVLKPGAVVKEGDVIVVLVNPELNQLLRAEEIVLSQIEAEMRQLGVNNKREVLEEQSILAELRAEFKASKMMLKAYEDLSGKGVVSLLEYEKGRLDVEQMNERVSLQEERQRKLQEVHDESLLVFRNKVERQKSAIQLIANNISLLNVRAPISGVVQRVPVELGQGVVPGQEVVTVGSNSDLVAEVRVAQVESNKVTIGMPVLIDTRIEKTNGVVSRIDPAVTNNSVLVEVKFVDDIPKSARPDLNVDAKIIVSNLSNVLLMETPISAREYSRYETYKQVKEGGKYEPVTLRLGAISNGYVELQSGGSIGDRMVVSGKFN